jgi:hypothetical protein
MKTNILYAYCPHCDYENRFPTNAKYRKGLKKFQAPALTWTCQDCGRKFESQIQWMTLGFESWCAFWLYQYQFNWKIPGVAVLVCALFVALTFYFDAYLPLWFKGLSMLIMFIGMGAGFLLLREIPYAYPVHVVNWHESGHRRPRRRTQWT